MQRQIMGVLMESSNFNGIFSFFVQSHITSCSPKCYLYLNSRIKQISPPSVIKSIRNTLSVCKITGNCTKSFLFAPERISLHLFWRLDFLSLTIALEERFTQHHLTALCGYRRKAAQKIILMATFNVNIVTKRCTLVLS